MASSLASLSIRLQPFLDQTNAEAARKAGKTSLYRNHIEKVIQADKTLAGRCFGDDNDMVIIEPILHEGGVLFVTIHLIIYPFSEASVANVHIYDQDGQHLGLPVANRLAVNAGGKWVDCRQFDRSTRNGEPATGQEYLISQSFTADKLPAQGRLKLIITGKNVSVNYAAEYQIASGKQSPTDLASVASLPQSVTTGRTPKRDGKPGYILAFDPERKSFKQSLIAIAFAGMYLEALLGIFGNARLGKTLYKKIDRQTTYEEKLRMLGVFDPNVLASCKRFREARNDLMHEKAVGLNGLKPVDIRIAQEEAVLGVEFVKSIGSKFETTQGSKSLRTSS
jgi:hypothetical protein